MSKAYDRAKQLYDDNWGDEYIGIHSKCVIDCCLGMIKETDLDPIVFEIAGWLHDLGRKDDKETHHELGLDYLEKFLERYPEYSSLKEEISDCILNHRRAQTPKTIYGKIMQAADKVSKHHKEWIEYKNSSQVE